MKKIILVGALCGSLLTTALFAPTIHHSIRDRLVNSNVLTSPMLASSGHHDDVFMQAIIDWIIEQLVNGAIGGSTQSQVGMAEKLIASAKELIQGGINFLAASIVNEAVADAKNDFTPENNMRACRVMEDAFQAEDAGLNFDIESKSSAIAMGLDNLNPNGSAADRQDQFITEVDSLYCSQGSIDRGRCTTLSPLADAHVDATAFYNIPGEGNPSTYSKEQYEASKAFIKVITGPVVPSEIPLSIEKTDAGKKFRVQHMVSSSYLSLAQQGLNRISAGRAPITGLSTLEGN